MEEPEVTHPAPREDVDVGDVPFERVRPFDAEERSDRSVRPRRFELVGGADEPERVRTSGDRGFEGVDLLVRRLRQAAHLFAERDGDESEELRPHAAVDHAWNIDMPANCRHRQRRSVAAEKVVADPTAPHERVGVEVDGRVGGVDGARLREPCNADTDRSLAPSGGACTHRVGVLVHRSQMMSPVRSARPAPIVVEDVLALVGSTPLVRIRRLGSGEGERPRAEVWAKAEQANPAGSVKDRIALAMIAEAEKNGRLTKGDGRRADEREHRDCARDGVCRERLPLRAHDAGVDEPRAKAALRDVRCRVRSHSGGPADGGAIARAVEVAAETPGAFVPGQFENPANPGTHARTTALEVMAAMDGLSIDAFVVGVGTGGTISGVGEVLKRERKPAPRIIGVEPASCATISRGERGPTKIQGLAAGFVPANFHPEVVDEMRLVTDEHAWATKEALATREGLLVGVSAGAAVWVALEVARELGPGKNVVTVLPDTGERYFSLAQFFPGEAAR